MKKERNILLARYLRGIARWTLLVVFALMFVMTLFSGSGDYGGDIEGVIKNSPNAFPSLILLIFLLIAWKWELVGGIIFVFVGLIVIFYFNILEGNYMNFIFFASLGIIIFGTLFIISWLLDQKAKKLNPNY